MPFKNSTANQFRVDIPKAFIPKHIKDAYAPYLHRMPTIISDVSDLVNHSIQSVSIPATSYEPITQQQPKENSREKDSRGFNRSYRAVGSRKELQDKTFTITFKMLDGFLNYWILQEVFWYYYDFENRGQYTFDVPIRIVDMDGVHMFSAMYTDVLFTGLGEFELSYANNIRAYNTFDCTFNYNVFKTSLDID